MLKFAYLKDMDNVDPFIISGVDGVKESEKRKRLVDATAEITYKTNFVVNLQPETVSLALV